MSGSGVTEKKRRQGAGATGGAGSREDADPLHVGVEEAADDEGVAVGSPQAEEGAFRGTVQTGLRVQRAVYESPLSLRSGGIGLQFEQAVSFRVAFFA